MTGKIILFVMGFMPLFLHGQINNQAMLDTLPLAMLLQPVLPYGHLDKPAEVPALLDSLVGKVSDISPDSLILWQKANSPQPLPGGNIRKAISRTAAGDSARYFVIHDVSMPNFGRDTFPPNINDSTWAYNDTMRWHSLKKTHVFITRTGQWATAVDFGTAWRATKLELKTLGVASRGYFIHIELVQPRRSAATGATGNDAIAPDPGFTPAQYRALALTYVCASVRAGRWLRPTFHAVLDDGIPGGHDDPQHFSLENWVESLQALLAEIPAVVAP